MKKTIIGSEFDDDVIVINGLIYAKRIGNFDETTEAKDIVINGCAYFEARQINVKERALATLLKILDGTIEKTPEEMLALASVASQILNLLENRF